MHHFAFALKISCIHLIFQFKYLSWHVLLRVNPVLGFVQLLESSGLYLSPNFGTLQSLFLEISV